MIRREVDDICGPVVSVVEKLLTYVRELERAAQSAGVVLVCDQQNCGRLVARDRICQVLDCTEQPTACITCSPQEYG